MKKCLIIILLLFIATSTIEARDYVKLQTKELLKTRKYDTPDKYFFNNSSKNISSIQVTNNIYNPNLLQIYNFQPVSEADIYKKIKEDEKIYSQTKKSLCKRNIDNYNAQARGEDYYKLYRVTEKIIRANRLDYMPWRVGISRDSDEFNAYSQDNLVMLNTSLFDTFQDNEDALAFVISHEISHILSGHAQRKIVLYRKMKKAYELSHLSSYTYGYNYKVSSSRRLGCYGAYKIHRRKYLIESKNMEYSADVQGAILASKAGYSLDKAIEAIAFLNTLEHDADRFSDHPGPENRIENFEQNKKYFTEDEWKNFGKYNIYNTPVLDVKLSSDRKTLVINNNKDKYSSSFLINNRTKYYQTETQEQLYLRYAYTMYLNGEFKKSINNFNKYFKLDQTNAIAYLYASYCENEIYKQTNSQRHLKNAKIFADKALKLASGNEAIKKQVQEL